MYAVTVDILHLLRQAALVIKALPVIIFICKINRSVLLYAPTII